MKRIGLENLGAQPHFIGSWMTEPANMCDQIVKFFEAHPTRQRPGDLAGGQDGEIKKTTDILIHPADISKAGHEPFKEYIELLYECYADYLMQWPFLETFMPCIDIGSFNIQRYQPGDNFQRVHTERGSLSTLHRVFAWMTYLNDVEDGGSTYFSHYDLDVQPQRGMTLIWPAEWTHAHSGRILNSGVKYIITGWMHFPAKR